MGDLSRSQTKRNLTIGRVATVRDVWEIQYRRHTSSAFLSTKQISSSLNRYHLASKVLWRKISPILIRQPPLQMIYSCPTIDEHI